MLKFKLLTLFFILLSLNSCWLYLGAVDPFFPSEVTVTSNPEGVFKISTLQGVWSESEGFYKLTRFSFQIKGQNTFGYWGVYSVSDYYRSGVTTQIESGNFDLTFDRNLINIYPLWSQHSFYTRNRTLIYSFDSITLHLTEPYTGKEFKLQKIM